MTYNKFQVSVGIPVYNGEEFVEKSVESAVHLPEVREVIIVDDGSTDKTYQICRELEEKHSNIRLLQHPGGVNKGLPASRNLAIKESACQFVAFLDADDFYLPNRFEKTKEVFFNYPDADGVHEPFGVTFYDAEEKSVFMRYMFNREIDKDEEIVSKFNSNIPPENLFHHLLLRDAGSMHAQTLTLKKSLFTKAGYFNEKLRLHGDDEAFLRFAYYGKLYPGETEKPVAIRGVHKGNRWTKQTKHTQYLRWEAAYKHFADKIIDFREARVLLFTVMGYHKYKTKKNVLLKYVSYIPVMAHLLTTHPKGFINLAMRILKR